MKKYYFNYIDLFYNYTIILSFINEKNNSDFAITPYLSLIHFKNGTKLFKHCIGLSLTWGYYSMAIGLAKENIKEQEK